MFMLLAANARIPPPPPKLQKRTVCKLHWDFAASLVIIGMEERTGVLIYSAFRLGRLEGGRGQVASYERCVLTLRL